MAIPSGTKFQGIPESNNDLNKRSAQIAARAPLYDILEIQSGQQLSTLIVQGIDNSTTARASYGINLVETASSSDRCTRLPIASTGKSCVIVNKTTTTITVFPSATGGSINGVVDSQFNIPGDSLPYTFTCIENPLPGAWTVSSPATNQIEAEEIQISHTNGSPSSAYNSGLVGVSNEASIGTAMSGGASPALILTGPFRTLPLGTPGVMVKLKIYTNILQTDIAGVSGASITGEIHQAYQINSTSSTSGARAVHDFDDFNQDWNVVTGLNYSGNVGDNGTIYKEIGIGFGSTPATHVIGDPNGLSDIVSNGYFTFKMTATSQCPTKDYKFKFFVEYQ